MRKSLKNLFVAACATAMVISVSACSSKPAETTAAPTTAVETSVEETTAGETKAEDTTAAESSDAESKDAEAADGSTEAAVDAAAAVSYKDGSYKGTGKGNNGDITVEVTVEGGKITAIAMTDHEETEGLYEPAETGVIEAIIKSQTTDVDTVSGATNTSNGIIEAVDNALKEAK